MRRQAVAASLLFLVACTDPLDRGLTAPVTVSAVREEGTPQNFQTHLVGDAEVPARETPAQGNVKFQLSPDGQTLHYKLIASNIENVIQAHIHLGPATCACPVVVFLYGLVPPDAGRTDGVLAEGDITQANMIGPLAGRPFEMLLDNIRAGNTYVNVHTRSTSLPPLVPGNFPGGEIRGQIDHGNGMHVEP